MTGMLVIYIFGVEYWSDSNNREKLYIWLYTHTWKAVRNSFDIVFTKGTLRGECKRLCPLLCTI